MNLVNDAVVGSMWRSFFGNLTPGLLRSPEKVKMRSLESSVLSVASARWARWPYQRSYGDKIDRVHRKMVASLLKIKLAEGEPHDAFCQRRHIVTGKKAASAGRWSIRWATATVNWFAHAAGRWNISRRWSGVPTVVAAM